MLDDAAIERWSRQILLPEVGGRGQSRLLAARVAVTGDGAAAAIVRDLLARGGVRNGDGGDVLVEVDTPPRYVTRGTVVVRATTRGAGGTVWTLVGRPCGLCLADVGDAGGPPDPVLDGIAAQALGALTANEVLCALLVPPSAGRGHRIDIAAGRYEAIAPRTSGACDACGGHA
jgi:hypothetical protein